MTFTSVPERLAVELTLPILHFRSVESGDKINGEHSTY